MSNLPLVGGVRGIFEAYVIGCLNSHPWYMREEMLGLVHDFLKAHIRGDEKEITVVTMLADFFLGGGLGRSRVASAKQVQSEKHRGMRISIIPVHGIIYKRINLLFELLGGVSTELVRKAIQASVDNPEIDGILLDIESPGGLVDGVKELADYIHCLRGGKPIMALANGEMASAALYIGSAAEKVLATPSALVGSIGVFMRHVEASEVRKQDGLKVNYIRSKQFKGTPNFDEPLTGEVRAYLQELVDSAYKLFVDDMAAYRNQEPRKVENEWGDGKMFRARKAMSMGMVDGIATFEGALEEVAKMAKLKSEYEADAPVAVRSI